jgi:hypothetical protein
MLLVICSGAVSIAGLALVLIGPNRRPLIGLGLAVALMFCAARDLDLTLQLLPCGVLGLLLTLVAAAIQRTVTHRRHAASSRFQMSTAGTTSTSNLAPIAVDDGSDESTAIRPRPAGMDAYILPPSSPPEPASFASDTGARP